MKEHNPKNVLLIIDHLDLGGAQNVVVEIVKYLNRNKYHPIVCNLRKESYISRRIKTMGVKVHNLCQAKYSPWALFQIIKILRQGQIDLVHTHLFKADTLGIIAAVINKIPVICHCHISDVRKDKKKWQILVDRFLGRFIDKIIFCSEVGINSNLMIKNIKTEKMKFIYNSIDLKNIVQCSSKKTAELRTKMKAGKYVVGTVARLSEQKGIKYLLEAASKIHDDNITYLIVGDGPLKDQLVGLSYKLGIQDRVVFTGFQECVFPYFCCMDIVVFPSLYEGLPIVLLEAMAMKVPIIATDVDGFKEVIKDGQTGLLVAAKDPSLLAKKITLLLGDKELALSLTQKARQTVKRFDSSKTISELEKVYGDVLNNVKNRL